MPGELCTPDVPTSALVSLETGSRAGLTHLRQSPCAFGLATLADRLARCCPTFHVLASANGHVQRPLPAERCRLRPAIQTTLLPRPRGQPKERRSARPRLTGRQ
jgi:hypothetical protein